MKKLLKTLSFVMTAAVSLAAVPMISAENSSVNAETEADYYMNPDNIAWEEEYGSNIVTAYKDGKAICLHNKQYTLCLKTTDGVELTAESLGLPEGMTVEKCTADYLGTITEDDADYCISADSEEEICQLAGMSEEWIKSGIAEEAFVHRIFRYCCGVNLTVNINLKEPDESFDPNSFEGLEDFTFEKKSDTRYEMKYFQCLDILTAPEIIENVQADERVESVETEVLSCCVAHYIFNDIPADEYYEKFSVYYGMSDEAVEESAKTPNDSAYYTNPHNIEWEGEKTVNGCLTVYKDGAVKNITQKQYTLGIKTADGTAPTAEELGLPEGMEIADNYGWYMADDESYDCFITVRSEDEIAELCKMSDDWIANGIIEEASVKILYCYGCLSDYTISVKLKNVDKDFDPNSVSGLEDVTFEQKSSSDNLYFSYRLPGIKFLEFSEIPDILKADERVESVDSSFAICEVVHTEFNEISTAEYLESYYIADEPAIPGDISTSEPIDDVISPAVPKAQVRGDISGNGEIDIYDAIEIAKYVMKMTDFDNEAMQTADFNGDGTVDLYDAIDIAKTLLG